MCSRVGEAVRRADHERVEGVLRVEAAALGPARPALDHGNDAFRPRANLRRRVATSRNSKLESALATDDVANCRADQAEEVALDPVARELARDDEHEGVAAEREAADIAEPLAVRPVAERVLESPRDLLPEVLCRQLDLVLHRRPGPPVFRPGGQHNSASNRDKIARFAGVSRHLPIPPQVWTVVGATRSSRIAAPSAAVDKPLDGARLY